MKPRNFITNLLLTNIFIASIVLVIISKIDWKVIFIGVAGIIVLIPEWILLPKHKAWYLTYKGVSQVAFIALIVFSVMLGFVFLLAYGLAEGFAQGCGGTVSHTEFDKFVASYIFYMSIPIACKVIMNIVDFILFKRELRNSKQKDQEEICKDTIIFEEDKNQ